LCEVQNARLLRVARIGVCVAVTTAHGEHDVRAQLWCIVAHAHGVAVFGTDPIPICSRHTIVLACTARRASAAPARLIEATGGVAFGCTRSLCEVQDARLLRIARIEVRVAVTPAHREHDIRANLWRFVAHTNGVITIFRTNPIAVCARYTIVLACTTWLTSMVATRSVEAAVRTCAGWASCIHPAEYTPRLAEVALLPVASCAGAAAQSVTAVRGSRARALGKVKNAIPFREARIGVVPTVTPAHEIHKFGTRLRGIVTDAKRVAAFRTNPVSLCTRRTIAFVIATRCASVLTTRLVEAAART
jgi:hypothetical protein